MAENSQVVEGWSGNWMLSWGMTSTWTTSRPKGTKFLHYPVNLDFELDDIRGGKFELSSLGRGWEDVDMSSVGRMVPKLGSEQNYWLPPPVVYCCRLEAAHNKVSHTHWSHTLSSSKRKVSADDIFQAKIFTAVVISPSSRPPWCRCQRGRNLVFNDWLNDSGLTERNIHK